MSASHGNFEVADPNPEQTLRAELAEAREILDAIRGGEVDAFVVQESGRDCVYLLKNADVARSILEQAAEAIVVCDTSGRVVRASAVAEQMCGRDPVGEPFEAAFGLAGVTKPVIDGRQDPDDRPFELSAVLQGTVFRGKEASLPRPGGGRIDLLLSAGPVRNDLQRIVGCVVLLTDIRNHKETLRALRQSEQFLREADRRKDEFLAMLAHELRNPLAAISSGMSLLQGPAPVEEAAWIQQMVLQQVGQLSRLVDDLLDVSRFTQGKISLQRRVFDVREAVERAAELVRRLMGEHCHDLDVRTAPEPLAINGDPARIEQVLVNLLTNAARYTPDGGRVGLTAARDGSDVVIRVRDTGQGISPELMPRLFDLFTQAEVGLGRATGGLGIGLALVRQLVELHGGTVAAASEGPGLGSEFTVRLPAHAGPVPEEEPGLPPPVQRAAAGCRILVAEDNPDLARVFAQMLEHAGHWVEVVHDGQAALEAALRQRPAVALIDLGLPKLDGYGVAEALRREGPDDVLLIAVSGYGQQPDVARARQCGFDHHLLKPVDYAKLFDLITRATEARPMGGEPREIGTSGPPEERAGGACRFLVIDDSQELAGITRMLLQGRGHECAVAGDAEAGLRAVREFQPDVVLCDLRLGRDQTGFDVARAIREDETLAPLFLIAVTAHTAQDIEDEARRAGFDLVLSKPLDLDALERLVERRPAADFRT